MILEGMPVFVSEHALVATWVYPVERFWEYVPSPETEDWCRYFGVGYERTDPGAYQVGGTLVIHPSLVECLRRM